MIPSPLGLAPAVMVHSAAQMHEALTAIAALGRPLTLVSPEDGSAALGVGGFAAAWRTARETHADLPEGTCFYLNCADRAGDALAAIKEGVPGVVFTGHMDIADKLQAMAADLGIHVLTQQPPAADLSRVADPADQCRKLLQTR